jgi:dihydrofolate synthase/folylpolyglutamate synthase
LEEFPTTKWTVVFGVMGDKNVEAMLESLKPVSELVIVTAAHSDRAVSPAALAVAVEGVGLPVRVAPSVEAALVMARESAADEGSVLVTGSLYLAGEIRDLLVS